MKKAILYSISLFLVLAILAAMIPVPAMAAGTTTGATMIPAPTSLTAVVTGDKIIVTSKNASDNRTFFVRARDAKKTTGGWYDIGKFKAFKNAISKRSFQVPKNLKGVLPLTVCFKEGQSMKVPCLKVTK